MNSEKKEEVIEKKEVVVEKAEKEDRKKKSRRQQRKPDRPRKLELKRKAVAAAPPPVEKEPPIVNQKNRCFHCNKKTSLFSTEVCRCGERFCDAHRLMWEHQCTYDIQKQHREEIRERNPVIKKIKVEKI